jgi:hypothetical protein
MAIVQPLLIAHCDIPVLRLGENAKRLLFGASHPPTSHIWDKTVGKYKALEAGRKVVLDLNQFL